MREAMTFLAGAIAGVFALYVILKATGNTLRALIAVVSVAFSGCTGHVLKLDQRFAPLTEIRESSAIPDGMVTTVYTEVLTKDLAELLGAYPQGSVELEALLRHEQLHAVHEFADPTFFPRYAASRDFRWNEEKAGWSKEIAYLREHGKAIDTEQIAEVLATRYQNMVSREEARAWLQEQLK
jgi:hypothetical protein